MSERARRGFFVHKGRFATGRMAFFSGDEMVLDRSQPAQFDSESPFWEINSTLLTVIPAEPHLTFEQDRCSIERYDFPALDRVRD